MRRHGCSPRGHVSTCHASRRSTAGSPWPPPRIEPSTREWSLHGLVNRCTDHQASFRMRDAVEQHGSADRRKDHKARKARLQAKTSVRRHERQQVTQAGLVREHKDGLQKSVVSGKARFAIISGAASDLIVAATWEHDGMQVQTYDMQLPTAMIALGMTAQRHGFDAEMWFTFLSQHMDAVADADDGVVPISLAQWSAGEGPTDARSLGDLRSLGEDPGNPGPCTSGHSRRCSPSCPPRFRVWIDLPRPRVHDE